MPTAAKAMIACGFWSRAPGSTDDELQAALDFIARGRAKSDPAIVFDEAAALAYIRDREIARGSRNVAIENVPTFPVDKEFRDAWAHPNDSSAIGIDIVKARAIQAGRMAEAQEVASVMFERERRQAVPEGRTVDATQRAADKAAVDALDLGVIGVALRAAADEAALKAAWPAELPRPS